MNGPHSIDARRVSPLVPGGNRPSWQQQADAWFKLLGAIVLAYLIIARCVAYLEEFGDVTVIAIGGVLVAYFWYPPVRWLNTRLPLWAALTIVFGGVAVLIVLAIYLLSPTIADQLTALSASIPKLEQTVSTYLGSSHSPLLTHLPPALRGYIARLPAEITGYIHQHVSAVTSSVTKVAFGFVSYAAVAVAIPIVALYMLGEAPMMKRYFERAIPAPHRAKATSIIADIDDVVGGFIRGQILVACCVAVLACIALFLLHVPYAIIIGIWAGAADVIPYIGPFAGGIPAVFVALITNGWQSAVYVGIAFILINQLEGHLLGPRIVGATVRITPLAEIFALLLGAVLFGFIGLIIAVPVAGIVRVIYDHTFPETEMTNAEIQPGLTHAPRVDVDPSSTEA